MLKVADILAESVVDGKGLRVVVFLQGCPRHCEGCHNPALIPFEGGRSYSVQELAGMIVSRLTPLHKGVTFSGGDPLAQAKELNELIMLLRHQRPDINIWVYTGYEFAQVKDYPVMQLIDVLVDGPFILALRDIGLPFKGSSNQKIIDVHQSLAQGKIVLAL